MLSNLEVQRGTCCQIPKPGSEGSSVAPSSSLSARGFLSEFSSFSRKIARVCSCRVSSAYVLPVELWEAQPSTFTSHHLSLLVLNDSGCCCQRPRETCGSAVCVTEILPFVRPEAPPKSFPRSSGSIFGFF